MNTMYSITSKNQVTIPKDVRKKLGIDNKINQVQFIAEGNRVYIERAVSVADVQRKNQKFLAGKKPASNKDIASARKKFYDSKQSW